jgi:hypothetical protein
MLDYELGLTNLRFQTLTIYFAAVGFIVGLNHNPSRAVGVLLLCVTVGLWTIDLRNRDMLTTFRTRGADVEEKLLGGQGALFARRQGPQQTAAFGFLNAQRRLCAHNRVTRWLIRLISFQVGIDIVFISVAGYASWLGWHSWIAVGAVAAVALVLWCFASWQHSPLSHTE